MTTSLNPGSRLPGISIPNNKGKNVFDAAVSSVSTIAPDIRYLFTHSGLAGPCGDDQ